MEPFVRRSHLLVSARDEAQVDMSWRHAADAVVLDLADSVPEVEKPRARANVKAAIPVAARGGAEVFVRLNKELAYADIMASAWPGLTGVVLTGAETAADVEEILHPALRREPGVRSSSCVRLPRAHGRACPGRLPPPASDGIAPPGAATPAVVAPE